VAGHHGDHDAVQGALDDPSPLVRQAAVAALHRLGKCTASDLADALGDESPVVRSRAAELCASVPDVPDGDPTPALTDSDASVVEIGCFACGEISWSAERPPPIAALSSIATSHDDALCRESAAAALGAIGDPAGLPAVLAACTDRVTVRRRAVLALAAFDDPQAEAALRTALEDKDWQVRQAAEDLLEVAPKTPTPTPPPPNPNCPPPHTWCQTPCLTPPSADSHGCNESSV